MSLDLKIVSPAKVEFRGQVERVVVPGTNGQFEILPNHAPIISSLEPVLFLSSTTEGYTRFR